MTRGMLAIWSDVEPEQWTDYLHWLTREHTSERVGIPGFQAVRVLRAEIPGTLRVLILYDLDSAAVLTSPEYLARLNAPSAWSRRIMPILRRFKRGGGTIVLERGRGQGGHAAALRLSRRPTAEDVALLEAIVADDAVCAARLLDVDLDGTQAQTSEKKMRAGDESFPGLLLIETLHPEALQDTLSRHRAALETLSGETGDTTQYALAFALQRHELEASPGSPA